MGKVREIGVDEALAERVSVQKGLELGEKFLAGLGAQGQAGSVPVRVQLRQVAGEGNGHEAAPFGGLVVGLVRRKIVGHSLHACLCVVKHKGLGETGLVFFLRPLG